MCRLGEKGECDMEFVVNGARYLFTRDDGEVVEFNPVEISFIDHQLERHHWRVELDLEIDSNVECLNFSKMSRDELIDCCMEELEEKWKDNDLDSEPDYQEIVFNNAQENKMWRDDK